MTIEPVAGTIIAWEDAIPAGWTLCDGTLGTPDLRGKFIYGATDATDLLGTGGASTHSHTNPASTVADAGHTHTSGNVSGNNSNSVNVVSGTGHDASAQHSSSWSVGVGSVSGHQHTLSAPQANVNTLSNHIKLYYIMKT